jgi:hypothetical protein
VMAYDLWWPGGAEQDAFVHGYFKGIYGMGRPYYGVGVCRGLSLMDMR